VRSLLDAGGYTLRAGRYAVELAEGEEIVLSLTDRDGIDRTVVLDREGVRSTSAGDEAAPDPRRLTYR
jgi:hypothetical protein